MITRFEKRTIACLLTVMMCLSVIFSGSMAVYAEDGQTPEASQEAENPESVGEGEAETDKGEGAGREETRNGGGVEGAEKVLENSEGLVQGENPEVKEKSNEKAETEVAEAFGDYEYQVLGGGTVEITKYNGTGGEVEIPAMIDGKNVSSIGPSAFAYNGTVTQVTIPATVTELQYYAFLSCYDLKKVILPEDSKLEVIDSAAFSGTGLTEINLTSVKKIGGSAFSFCQNLEAVTLGNQLTSIGEWAFSMTGIHKIDIPDSVTSIGRLAFSYCENLQEVNIGNQLEYIAEDAFYESALTTVKIGGNVKKIGKYAFADNSKIGEMEIPKNVTEIEYAAFQNCTSLNKISIPESLEKIGGFALNGTAWYENQGSGVVYAGNVLYDYKGDMPSGTVIEAKNGTLGIAGYAFDGDKNLEEIKIPETVTNIGDFAFHDCVSMTSVVIPESVAEIGEKALGYKTKEGVSSQSDINARAAGDNSVKIPNFTIYGKAGSAAQTYANDNSFVFVAQKTDNPAAGNLRIVPEVTDNTYIIGSGDGVTITCTGELKDFVNVMMDGTVVDPSNYTLKEGSTILTFVTKYLDTLSVGRHTVTLNYTYGSVDTQLTVLAKGSDSGANGAPGAGTAGNGTANGANGSGQLVSPKTGDPASVMLWLLTAMCALGIGVLVIRRGMRHNQRNCH